MFFLQAELGEGYILLIGIVCIQWCDTVFGGSLRSLSTEDSLSDKADIKTLSLCRSDTYYCTGVRVFDYIIIYKLSLCTLNRIPIIL